MEVDWLSFSAEDIYNLQPILIRANSKEQLNYTFFDKDGNLIDITGAKVIWTLSEFGYSDITLLKKEGVLSSDYSSMITLRADDTKDLEGKFVQQITLKDYLDEAYEHAQGIIKISPNNNNE